MKIRTGFVSNSSSSSFLISFPKDMKKSTLENVLKNSIITDKNHILYSISKEIAKGFIDNIKSIPIISSIKQLADYEGFKVDDEEFLDAYSQDIELLKTKSLIKNVFDDEDSDYIETFLCNTDLNFKTDTGVEVQHSGGY